MSKTFAAVLAGGLIPCWIALLVLNVVIYRSRKPGAPFLPQHSEYLTDRGLRAMKWHTIIALATNIWVLVGMTIGFAFHL